MPLNCEKNTPVCFKLGSLTFSHFSRFFRYIAIGPSLTLQVNVTVKTILAIYYFVFLAFEVFYIHTVIFGNGFDTYTRKTNYTTRNVQQT